MPPQRVGWAKQSEGRRRLLYSRLPAVFCPLCKAEYPQECTRCSSCNVELVDAAPGFPGDSSSDGNLVLLWAGDDLALQSTLLEELKAAGIPYFNRPVGNYSLRAFPNRYPSSSAPPFGFEVSVLSSDLKRAQVVLRELQESSELGSVNG